MFINLVNTFLGMVILKGKVESGICNFSYWMEKLELFYTKKCGMKLFPGTLNVKLDTEWRLPKKRIRLEKEEYSGTVSVNIVPCKIFGRKAFILRNDKAEDGLADHDRTVIEVATDVKLRDEYDLEDGDMVEVEVD